MSPVPPTHRQTVSDWGAAHVATEEAFSSLGKFVALARSGRYASSYAIRIVYAALGDRQRALSSLEAAYRERSHWLVWLKRYSGGTVGVRPEANEQVGAIRVQTPLMDSGGRCETAVHGASAGAKGDHRQCAPESHQTHKKISSVLLEVPARP